MTRRALRTAGGFATAVAFALPATALAQEAPPAAAPEGEQAARQGGGPAAANLHIRLKGASHNKLDVGDRVRVIGRMRPFVGGQHAVVRLARSGKPVERKEPLIRQKGNKNVGKFSLRFSRLIKPGSYRVRAWHKPTSAQGGDDAKAPQFRIHYPDLDPGDTNNNVQLFNELLEREGYYTSHGRHYDAGTERAVMAFRKVQRMDRSWNATSGIFKTLADGRGTFNLRYPGQGRHVEVDISRQVMVLADHGQAKHIFHVSTGAPSTPTIRGHYRFYRRQPGYNSVGMYYSVYFRGGYAIHGYHSVPPYNASHGCVRNPIPNSRFIYNWVRLGMSIYTYN